jgi:hypothetical protein
MSAATVSAQPQVPAESRLKGIIANKTIRNRPPRRRAAVFLR